MSFQLCGLRRARLQTELELRLEARIAERPVRMYQGDWSDCAHDFSVWTFSVALHVRYRECRRCGLIEGYAR